MRRFQRTTSVRLLLLCLAGCMPILDAGATVPVTAQVTPTQVVLRNGLVQRVWSRVPFRTQRLTDLRNGRDWTSNSPDFTLDVQGLDLASTLLAFGASTTPKVDSLANGGVRLTMVLTPQGLPDLTGLKVTRIVEMYPGVAGMRTETFVESAVPLDLTGYTLDQAMPSDSRPIATIHSFRAGADWREPEWTGPTIAIGNPRSGDWRATSSGPTVSGTAQWLSLADHAGRRLFYVLERNDFASSMMSFDGITAKALVDLRQDLIYLGPFEEEIHVEDPALLIGRHRLILPGTPLRLEPVFTGVALNRDDEPVQHFRYLTKFRMPPYSREVTFNSNGVDRDRISTGAKDDMDFGQFLAELAVAKQIGIETFIFDDGWQARSGDWCPDAVSSDPACTEPRRGSDPKFAPRFPDPAFQAVQAELAEAGMHLGLWMSPMHFHPSSVAFTENPGWVCAPVGTALTAYNLADPASGSNEAGIAQWNPEALNASGVKFIDYLESRIRRAIDDWGVRYFKFDFTAWIDCAGLYPVDLYGYRESFMAMLDRILRDHPDVTIQMDETNDYRLFPFEAIARGPTWYQNGSPTPPEALHANYLLAPYLPLFALGRSALRPNDLAQYPVDYQMAVALLSHITFFNELTNIPEAVRPAIKTWMTYYRKHRAELATMAYPLLAEDPLSGDNWAAFQTWDAHNRRGALLVYRQDAPDDQRIIRLRNIPAGTYQLREAPAETNVLTFTAGELRAGVPVSIPSRNSARVFRIRRLP